MNATEGILTVFMGPMLRYVSKGCCGDPEHMANRATPGFESKMLVDLAAVYRTLKEFLHNDGYVKFTISKLSHKRKRDSLSGFPDSKRRKADGRNGKLAGGGGRSAGGGNGNLSGGRGSGGAAGGGSGRGGRGGHSGRGSGGGYAGGSSYGYGGRGGSGGWGWGRGSCPIIGLAKAKMYH
jgi:hypothetical protein